MGIRKDALVRNFEVVFENHIRSHIEIHWHLIQKQANGVDMNL
jgi:hypothetical protein